METYNLINANGYIVFECNGKNILVDLGMPFSVSRQPIAFSICNNNCSARPHPDFDFDQISQDVGVPIDAFICNDNLGKFKVLIDMPGKKIFFDTREIPFEGTEVPCCFSGYVSFNPIINGVKRRMVLDTGAPMSYVEKYVLDGCPKILDEYWDFNPAIGRFSSPVFEVPIAFAGHEFKILCAPQHPIISQSVVNHLHADGVLGGNIFAQHKVLIDIAGCNLKMG